MTDYYKVTDLDPRALVRAALIDATDTYPGDVVHTDALARVQAYSLAALALTLPQGAVDTGQTTGFVAPAPSPAEPSLVALDRGDEAIGELRRWREADRIFPCEAAEWWDATLRLRDVADRIGGALSFQPTMEQVRRPAWIDGALWALADQGNEITPWLIEAVERRYDACATESDAS